MEIKRRELNPDIIRSLAIIQVLVIHWFDNSGFYEIQITEPMDFFSIGLKLFMTSCVPLFLMLSGYLSGGKRFSKKYYLGFLRILELYLLCSLLCIAYRWLINREPMDLREAVGSVVNFRACGYGWYVMMYLGLFLMMPFVNAAYASLPSKGAKLVLVGTMFALSILPSLLNLYIQLWSVWWTRLYPLCFYLTGMYLREYLPQWRSGRTFVLMLGFVVLFSAFQYFYYDGVASFCHSVAYENFQVYTVSVLLFISIARLPEGSVRGIWPKLFTEIARLSFSIYLLSWISDSIVYPIMQRMLPEYRDQLPWLPVFVIASFIIAFILAWFVRILYNPIDRVVRGFIVSKIDE